MLAETLHPTLLKCNSAGHDVWQADYNNAEWQVDAY